MDPNDRRWLQHLDIVTAWGEASAIHQTPPPTDAELWDVARLRRDLNLPERIDPVLLADLRDAFNAGRRPTRIDLQAVADAVTARGIPARVLDSGGGTATLYAGAQRLDPDGDIRFTVSAGPGWFEAPGNRQPVADTAEFGIGPHDDGWGIGVPQHATTLQIADLVVAVTEAAEAQLARFTATVTAALAAVWAVLAAAYPDAVVPDLPAALDAAVAAELRRLLTAWLWQYWPAYHTPPPHLAAATGPGDDGTPAAAADHQTSEQ